MAISYISSASGTNTATLGTHTTGDLILVFAFRDGNTTAPSLPAGFTSIQASGASSCSARMGWKIAASGSETVGTWTNATSVIAAVYRGTDGVGGSAITGGSSTVLTFPAVTMLVTNGTSWVVGGVGHRSTNVAIETAPSGMTNRISVADATDEAALHDTNGGVNNQSKIHNFYANGNVVLANSLVVTDNVSVTTGVFSGNGSALTDLPVANITGLGNIATINLDGNASNALLGDGSFGPVEVTSNIISNGTSNVNIATSGGNITVGVGGTANTVVFASTTTTINTPIRTANTVIVGNGSGNTSYAVTRGDVAIGYQSGTGTQAGDPSIAVGFQSGNVQQNQGAVAIGFKSGRSQGDASIGIGYQAGESQGSYSVAIGLFAGQTNQQGSGVAIGNQAGKSTQGAGAVAIGVNAGMTSQGANSIAIGQTAGPASMFANGISIGTTAKVSTTAPSIAIGAGANANGQYSVVLGDTAKATGNYAISIGSQAGGSTITPGSAYGISVGASAGFAGQGANTIAIGTSAAEQSQNAYSIAIGFKSGQNNQGANAISIGANAGFLNQANNTIILNATGANLNMTTANTFTVKPVRNANASNVLYYDNSTGEITYSTATSGVLAGTATGNISMSTYNLQLRTYQETYYDAGTVSGFGSIIFDAQNGTMQRFTFTGPGNKNVLVANMANCTAGSSYTWIINNTTASNTLGTSDFYWAGGDKTITASGLSIISVFTPDGTTFYGSIVKGFAVV